MINCNECGKLTRPQKGMCKACYAKDWRRNNPQKSKSSKANWTTKNPDKVKEAGKRRYARYGKHYGANYSKSDKGRYAYSKSKAKSLGQHWDLTLEEYVEARSKPCHYCQGPLPHTSRAFLPF